MEKTNQRPTITQRGVCGGCGPSFISEVERTNVHCFPVGTL